MEISADTIDQLYILLDIVIACILGGIVGLEREMSNKPAGFRTNMLIAGSAALFVCVSKEMVLYFPEDEFSQRIMSDPIRVIQAIVVGVSFIGAGTILKQKGGDAILYLTTAATILFSTGIGICVALHKYYLAVGLVIIVFIINRVIKYFENKATKPNPSQKPENEKD